MQIIPNADAVSEGVNGVWKEVERAWADGHITDLEKLRVRRLFAIVRVRARGGALSQQIGIRLIRGGRCDKNLMTQVRDLERFCREAGWSPEHGGHEEASRYELEATG